MKTFPPNFRKVVILFVVGFVAAVPAAAHCDTMTGPVVTAARRALDTGNINTVLKWVRPQYEAEVREAFAAARRVRTLNAEATALADKYFFETVVRLHRTGEGEPYSGLKAAADAEPGIAAADNALESGNVEILIQGFGPDSGNAIRQRFKLVQQTQSHADENLAAGRQYVEAYVDFIRYVHELEQPPRNTGHAGASSDHQSPTGPAPAKIEIDQFKAEKTRLKKNEETNVGLAFRVEPMGAHISWRVACVGIAIKGWNASQLLSVVERLEGGTIQTIEGRDYVATDKSIVITVKRPKTATKIDEASCTVALQGQKSEQQQKTIQFELR